MNDLYSITDLNGYSQDMRDAAAKSLKDDYNDNLDEYISIQQVYNIVAKESVALDDDDRYVLDQEANEKVFETIRVWIHNCGLAKLAGNDLLECAWDSESNEMVFWIKNQSPIINTNNDNKKSNKRTKRKNS